ncbi:MAG: NAD(+)/NADH kinase [bacterium]
MHTIGIIANTSKPQVKEVAIELIAYLEKKKKAVILESDLARLVNRPKLKVPMKQISVYSDLILVLGGDGTLIYAARMKALGDKPVLGINLGSLGFLTSISVSELYLQLELLWRHQFLIEPRMMLEAEILESGNRYYSKSFSKKKKIMAAPRSSYVPIQSFLAFNDVVVAKEALARIIELTISIDQNQVTQYQADGLIVATPTGSTAHSLSAGGPIVHPNLQALIITPICPHTLSNRPLIISDKEEVEIEMQSPESQIALPDATSDVGAVYLTIDGQQGIQLSPNQRIRIRKAKEQVNLMVFPTRSYYEVLRTKLHWGRR